jgi:hypothetical protein
VVNKIELARVDVAAALAAIHSRFANLVADNYSKTVHRSMDLQACENLDHIPSVVAAYRYFIDDVAMNGRNYQEQNAARQCTIYARELVSISALITAYPDEASRRAKTLLQKKYANRRSF